MKTLLLFIAAPAESIETLHAANPPGILGLYKLL